MRIFRYLSDRKRHLPRPDIYDQPVSQTRDEKSIPPPTALITRSSFLHRQLSNAIP